MLLRPLPSRYLEGTLEAEGISSQAIVGFVEAADKNVSTFWRCRNNIFCADGAGGRFIVVMPDQDVVVAITADSDNMQAELDAIFR